MANNMSPIAENIEILSREKKIDPQIVIDAIGEAVLKAYQKQHRNSTEDIDVRYNPDSGQIEIFARMTVVEEVADPAREISLSEVNSMIEGAEMGDILEMQRPFEGLGRIAAQTAKQVITQTVREAERNNVYDEYIKHVGELVHGFVKRFEKRGDIVVDLGQVEALLPRSEQSRAEKFSLNERIRAVIIRVTKDVKETYGQQIILSRTSPDILKRLFEMEVPEIYDGTVQVRGAVREAGERSKIAVASTDRDVDPVGACVGMRGSRVQAVIRELHGEKIDIIQWSDNPAIFAANALSPAKVSKVQIINPENKRVEVIVEDDQQSLAIGKQGQNVRLAARLLGWNIDIRSESDIKREVASQMEVLISGGQTPMRLAEGKISGSRIAMLAAKGITALESLVEVQADDLAERLDCSLDEASALLTTAGEIIAKTRPASRRPAVEAGVTQAAPVPEATAPEATAQEAVAADALVADDAASTDEATADADSNPEGLKEEAIGTEATPRAAPGGEGAVIE
ncbi:MAG: transcription termination/antitermination protein NusA [Acidobacteria bacterium]|nr:transcription termination/antitermination protein NusA [Acidobacteriota bacterium]